MLEANLPAIVAAASAVLAVTSFVAGRMTARSSTSAHSAIMPTVAADNRTPPAQTEIAAARSPWKRLDGHGGERWAYRPEVADPEMQTQKLWLEADAIAKLYVEELRSTGMWRQTQISADLDRDVRAFCDKNGIHRKASAEVREAIACIPGVTPKREYLSATRPEHAYALQRAKVLGLKSGRATLYYVSRSAPKKAQPVSDSSADQAASSTKQSRPVSDQVATAPQKSAAGQRLTAAPKLSESGDLFIGHELPRQAA